MYAAYEQFDKFDLIVVKVSITTYWRNITELLLIPLTLNRPCLIN